MTRRSLNVCPATNISLSALQVMAMMVAPILVGWDRTELRREVSGTRETKLTACSDVNQSRYYVELRKDPITRHSPL